MNKKIFIGLIFTLLLSILAYSQTQENKIDLKGKVIVKNRVHPEITSNNKTYYLMMPQVIIDDLKDGEEISVSGYKDEIQIGKGFKNREKVDVIYVSKLVVDGITIDIEKEFRFGRGREFIPDPAWNRRNSVGEKSRKFRDRDFFPKCPNCPFN